MAARYQLRMVGVWDRDLQRLLVRHDPLWADYQQWLAAGNTPDPQPLVPPPPPTQAETDARAELERRRAIGAQLTADAEVQTLRQMTPDQANAWADGVTGFAEARRVIKVLARVVALLARERLT